MRVLVFDTETTGLPQTKILNPDTLNQWPTIVQFSFVIYDLSLNDIVESKGNFMPSKVNFRDGSFYFWDLPVTVSFGYEWEIIGNIHEGEKNDN